MNVFLKLTLIISVLFLIACKNEVKETNKIVPPSVVEKKIEPVIIYGFNANDYKIDTSLVKKNEGLTHILPKYGVSPVQIFTIAERFDSVFDVRKIKPNHICTAFIAKDTTRKLLKFVYQKDAINYVVFDFTDSINVYLGAKEVVIKELEAGGVVTSSLWNAFIDEGLSPALVVEVTKLYAWSIDFFGIQKGDYFKVIYQAKYVDDKFVGIGRIKTVLFNHMDKSRYFFSYESDTIPLSYFGENGESMKRALLSAPLQYTRISSKFSNRRFHPVLKYYRPHHGVDYAAPIGTEVVATGTGKVIFAGWAGGAGRLVKIKHVKGDVITKYMHLSKFAKGIKKGVHVIQGQKIGEVGSSGHSTGPHLDYRIFMNGKAVNPLSIDIPSVEPLKDSALILYKDYIAPIKLKLDAIQLDSTSLQ